METSVPPSLLTLCHRIEALSKTPFILHPSKCRCLAHSYSELTRYALSLIPRFESLPSSSSSPSPFPELSLLYEILMRSLEKGERFIQDCSYQPKKEKRWSGGKQRNEWLINKALLCGALGMASFDVHLHDFVWCISLFVWVFSDYGECRLRGWIEARGVDALLKSIWASADEKGDVESMQELFSRIGAKRHRKICNLICNRLSESASKTTASLTDTLLPTYLWMDPQHIEMLTDRVLGSNEFVVVYEARLMGGRFACKYFHREEDEEQFKYEAAIHARLCHANVVHLVCCTVVERASKGKTYGLLIELMDQDLRSLITERSKARRGAPFSLFVGVDLMLQVAKGMEYLHGLGIMHRDLKSPNILIGYPEGVSSTDETGPMIAKLADFGVSKFSNFSLYTTKHVGTSIWRAPEVVDDEDPLKYTEKADVYSFAIVCAEILTGCHLMSFYDTIDKLGLSKN